jgi:phosphoribosylformimino-5-aminoimidazole carboxamide ribotide isomerase
VIAIPALYLRDGTCVQPGSGPGSPDRLRLGDPSAAARAWAHAGFRRLHLVDLDAESNSGANTGLIEDLIRDCAVDVQVEGGVRSAEQVQGFFDAGATSVIVGDRAFEEPEWLANLADLFPGTIVVSTAVRERRVATRGWVRTLPLDIFDVVDDLNGLRLGGLLVTQAVTDDGTASLDLALLEDVASASEFPVLAAYGAATMNDLRALEHRGIAGAIIDIALYTGELDPRAVSSEFAE